MDFSRLNRFNVKLEKNKPAQSKNGVFEISNKDHAKVSGILTKIDISKIRENPHQARSHMKQQEFNCLKKSIQIEGLLEPIIVLVNRDNDSYELKAGHRRLRAITELGYKYIDAFVYTDVIEATFAAISTNEFSEKIHLIDKGIEVESLITEFKKNGHTINLDDIATFYGVSVSTIKEWKQYAKISESVRAEITKRDIRSKEFLRKAVKICTKIERTDLSENEKKEALNIAISELINSKISREAEDEIECLNSSDGPEIRNFLYYNKKNDSFLIRDVANKLSKKDKARLKRKALELIEML